jgi:hypothetical protein
MRFYAFGNYYLSSLQQALQANHVCVELYNKYNFQFLELKSYDELTSFSKRNAMSWSYLREWAKDHKTIVLLNGGNSKDLRDIHNMMMGEDFERSNHDYPFASFHEDEQSLNGALTSVGIVLPAKIYETAANDRSNTLPDYIRPRLTQWEEKMVLALNRCGLAK